MSEYKSIGSIRDSSVTKYTAHKNWSLTSASFTGSSYTYLRGIYPNNLLIPISSSLATSELTNSNGSYMKNTYYGINHLYYNFYNPYGYINYGSGNFSRKLNHDLITYSLPRIKVGDKIKPSSVYLTLAGVENESIPLQDNGNYELTDLRINTSSFVTGELTYLGFNNEFDLSKVPNTYTPNNIEFIPGISIPNSGSTTTTFTAGASGSIQFTGIAYSIDSNFSMYIQGTSGSFHTELGPVTNNQTDLNASQATFIFNNLHDTSDWITLSPSGSIDSSNNTLWVYNETTLQWSYRSNLSNTDLFNGISVTLSGNTITNLDADLTTAGFLTATPDDFNNINWSIFAYTNGYQAKFNGTNSAIEINNTTNNWFNVFDNDFAISLWMTPYSTAVTQSIISKAYYISNSALRRLASYPFDMYYTSASLNVKRYDGIYTSTLSASINNLNQNYHIVYQKTGSNLQIYRDGTLISTVADTTVNKVSNNYSIFVGALGYGYSLISTEFPSPFNGAIDEVRIYGKSLTQAEITSLSTLTNTNYLALQTNKVGNVFYEQGMLVYSPFQNELITGSFKTKDFSLKYKSSIDIDQYKYYINVPMNDYNTSTNPTLYDTTGSLLSFATDSDFTPYITTIGLYDKDYTLVAIAKLGSPIPKSSGLDLNFEVSFDRS
jgi:hypothetical protein